MRPKAIRLQYTVPRSPPDKLHQHHILRSEEKNPNNRIQHLAHLLLELILQPSFTTGRKHVGGNANYGHFVGMLVSCCVPILPLVAWMRTTYDPIVGHCRFFIKINQHRPRQKSNRYPSIPSHHHVPGITPTIFHIRRIFFWPLPKMKGNISLR